MWEGDLESGGGPADFYQKMGFFKKNHKKLHFFLQNNLQNKK
jgi:hypothetical protein